MSSTFSPSLTPSSIRETFVAHFTGVQTTSLLLADLHSECVRHSFLMPPYTLTFVSSLTGGPALVHQTVTT